LRKAAFYVLTICFQGVVILSTMGFLSVGMYGLQHIEVGFDMIDLLPADSYLAKYLDIIDKEHPESGFTANIIIDKIMYTAEDFESINKERKII
jgi:predicted RND superfamily exporter protein